MKTFKILIVDDERDFLEMIIRRLKKRKLDVVGAVSGEEAMEKIQKDDFDVVLLDVKMAGMSGIDTLREIKRLKPLTEVVMLTGHASVESGIDGMKLGAFDYLMKPMEIEPLLEKLADAYEKKAIHEAKITQTRTAKKLTGNRRK